MAGKKKAEVRDTSSVYPVGSIIRGKYEVVEKISAHGGMSNVYKVRDKDLRKEWVLKQILLPSRFEGKVSASTMARVDLEYRALSHEASIMASLSHAGIPRITEIHEDEATQSKYIIMDYVEGRSAASILSSAGFIEEAVAVAWVRELCAILAYLHSSRGGRKEPIVYRDVKPENMMITDKKQVYLIDFGTAEEVPHSEVYPLESLGTRGYAAPEQSSKSNPLTLQSDIFGVGATLYTLLVGQTPNAGRKVLDDNGNEVLDDKGHVKIDRYQPKYGPYSIRKINSSLSTGLEEVVRKCTEPSLENRYQSIEEVIEALTHYKTLDKEHRKTMSRKVFISNILMAAGVLCTLGAGVPYVLDRNERGALYENALKVANQSGKLEDYKTAISMRPTVLDPYYDLIEVIKQDGIFSPEEEKVLLGLINPNITTISSQDGYPELAYSIGELYWFYYPESNGSKGSVLATTWLKDAIDGGYTKNGLAQVYYNLGDFDKTISSAAQESNDKGLYKKYWESLKVAKNSGNGEIVDLQILLALANFISTYTNRLKGDGIPLSEVNGEVRFIQNYLRTNRPSPGTAEDLFNRLQSVSEDLQVKVDTAYGSGE